MCVKISDISDALNIPRPGVTHTFKDMVNGALVLQAAYGAVDLHLNQAERKKRHEIASIEKKRRPCASALFFGFSIRRHRPRRLAHASR